MDEKVCKIFESIWKDFPDTLSDGNYKFKDGKTLQPYCGKQHTVNCECDTDKIMAGWIYLFKKHDESDLIKDSAPNSMNIVEYIIIWLIYMLKLKDDNTITNLKEAFKSYIDDRGGHNLTSTDKDYSEFIEKLIVNKNYLVDMDKNIIFKFYEAFKILCSMYNDINSNTSDCTKHNAKAKELADKYQNLLNNINTKDSQHSQMLSILSTDYDKFKKYCNEKCTGCSSIPPLPTTKTTQISPHISEDASSSSSIASKFIPVLSVFVAIPIFLGIAYKYSLFGIGKRSQKRYLREKRKKAKRKVYNYILLEERDYSRNSNNY
ncbi:CIR protein [Plasmodium chabaudi chabaudi]|uniref:CIR protein n=1 Tax=Plasmodium chabaudi chabaudi TaxID=31271 RepID=A0A1C6WE51_PLACU|nr:CIR protein [Plasmodium chabaudi chabaudi]